jgi:hypothetical protein
VVVRGDLSTSQQAVQAGHAVATWHKDNPNFEANSTLVYLKVKSKEELSSCLTDLKNSRLSYVKFQEPDIDDELTAVATGAYEARKIFKGLDLM